MKRVLRLFLATVLLVAIIGIAWLGMTQSGLRWAYSQAEPYLPDELNMRGLEGRLIGPITLTGLDYQQDGTLINAEQIIVDWQPAALLAAKIDISRLHVQSLNIVLPESEKTDQPFILPEINLPWRLALKDLVIDGVSVKQNEQTYGFQQIKLSATSLLSQVDIDELSITANSFSVTVNGELQPTQYYHHDLALSWQAALPSSAVIKGTGRLKGDIKMTRIKQQLSGPLQLTFDAELSNLLEQLNWQGKANVTAFDTEKLGTDWPAINGKLQIAGKGDLTTATLSGNVDGDYREYGPFDAGFTLQRLSDNSIQIDELMLHTPVTDTSLHARGQWMPGSDGGHVDVALNWQNLRWPLGDGVWFDSAIGSGWVEGNLHDYRAGLATDRPWPQAPPSFWYASADGNLDGLNVHSLRINALSGETLVKGKLDWTPHLTWQAQASASHIDPTSLFPKEFQWPGELTAKLTSSGRTENGQLIVEADITRLEGTLRGYPVSLRSRLGWRSGGHNSGLDISTFDFHSGGSRVTARGRVGETLKLDWDITATDLAELYPHAHGQLQAKGQLSGPRETPKIDATINGKALSLPGYNIGNVDAVLAVDLFRWQDVNIKLAAQTLKLNDYVLQSLNIDADSHHLQVKVVSDTETALVALKGDATETGWRGQIERADIESRHFAAWQLKAPAALTLNKKDFALETLCLHSNQAGKFCASLQRQNEKWKGLLEMDKLPLMVFSTWLPAGMELSGVANGRAELELEAPDKLSAHARIDLPPGDASYPLLEGEGARWEYDSGHVEISVNEQGVTATSDLDLTSGEQFHSQFALPGANLLALDDEHQPLKASARITSQRLRLIEILVPDIYDVRGEVDLNMSATGTLAQPKLSGQFNLLNGSLQIPKLGLTINQINLKSQSDAFEKFNFILDAQSGEGNLTIQGQTTLDRKAGWPTEASVKAKEFEISRIPEARVLVSPDLQIKLQKRTIDIRGDVRIPYAKLQPKDLSSAAKTSKDAVIIASQEEIEETWAINTQVRVTLGENVTFYGFGFDGRFDGSVLLKDQPGQLTKATGEIGIPEGRYQAYGQQLDIEHGRLIFTGGPANNPGLDLRAVRHVNEVTAGLRVRGNLSQPQIELFTIPAMGQTDALSYLLLGRPIENTSEEEGNTMATTALALGMSGGNELGRKISDVIGVDEVRVDSSSSSSNSEQASLTVGHYLSPKLYVSYGLGLVEAFNTFTVRYKLSEKWQLVGESGENTGADVLYIIER